MISLKDQKYTLRGDQYVKEPLLSQLFNKQPLVLGSKSPTSVAEFPQLEAFSFGRFGGLCPLTATTDAVL